MSSVVRPGSHRALRIALPWVLAATLAGVSLADNKAKAGFAGCEVGCGSGTPSPTGDSTRMILASEDGRVLPRVPAPRPNSFLPPATSPSTVEPGRSAATAAGSDQLPLPASRSTGRFAESRSGPLSVRDLQWFVAALAAARLGQWDEATEAAESSTSPIPGIVVRGLWLADENTNASFSETLEFLESHPDWPTRRIIRIRLENRIGDAVRASRILRLFEREDPNTGSGWLRFALALRAAGQDARSRDAARTAWRAHALDERQEEALLTAFAGALDRSDHLDRLDHRIREGDWDAAGRQLHRVPASWRLLGRARMSLARREDNANQAVARVPEALRNHPSLIFERARWHRRAGRLDAARDLLVPPPDNLPEPDLWWKEIDRHLRDRLQARDFAEAYRMASSYPAFRGEGRRGGAWLSGWIALEFLRLPPERAMEHLQVAWQTAWHPADRALAAYWQSRAAMRMYEFERARAYAEAAARWPSTFFGQLALRSLDLILRLPDRQAPNREDDAIAVNEFHAQIVLALGQAEGGEFAWPFVDSLLLEAVGEREAAAVIDLCVSAGLTRQALRAARRSVAMGLDLADRMFLLPTESQFPRSAVHAGISLPIALAVANQESGFDRKAVSHVGARGVMQVMPRTAKRVTHDLSIPYREKQLLEDPAYNVRLGTTYLRQRLDLFDGSLPLALAAYNGGTSRVRKWLQIHGDPRGDEARLVNWILLIPYRETRDYVQRVLERISAYEILVHPEATASIPLRHLAS